jgi:hypothetical protein
MKQAIRLSAVVLAVSVVLAHASVVRAEGKFLQVIGIKVPGNVGSYLEKVKKAQTMAMRLGMPPARVWRATLAGPDTGTILIGIEFPTLAAMEEAQRKVAADADWQKLMKEMDKSGRTVVSNSLFEDITP